MANGWDTSTGETGDYANDPAYQALFQQILGNTSPNGVWDYGKTNSTLTDQGQQFASMYQNLTGQAPTADAMNSFYSNIGSSILNSPGGESGSNYASNQSLITPYIQNTYGQQINDYQQQQQIQQQQQLAAAQQASIQAQLPQQEANASQLVGQLDQQTQQQLLNPQNQAMIQGSLNNSGMLNSGAFGDTLASLLAQGANQNQSNVLSGSITPTIAQEGNVAAMPNLSNVAGQPYQNMLSASNSGLTGYGSTQSGIQNFNMEAALANELAAQGAPSTAQSILGLASGSAGGAGSLLSGGAQAYKAYEATWICTAMREAGVLSYAEVGALHTHLYKAFWNKPFKFLSYWIFGKLLVRLANKANTNWALWREAFYDDVLEEKDPVKAIDLYENAFWKLHALVQIRLANRRENGFLRGS